MVNISEVQNMYHIIEGSLGSFFVQALENIKLNNIEGPKLVSITKEINSFDAILSFEVFKKEENSRIFWSDPTITMVGVGRAFDMTADYSRFDVIKTKWQNCLNQAIVHNPYQSPGTGLVAFGGMSFDPDKPRTALWKKFKPSHFIIPQLLLTKNAYGYYLTITLLLDKTDHEKNVQTTIDKIESLLATEMIKLPERARILKKQEIAVDQWKKAVQKAKDKINHQEAQKIVLARELRLQLDRQVEISPILHHLLETQPTSYVFAIEMDGDCFVGATPERLVKIEGKQVLSTCLAGTAPRGQTQEEDEHIKEALLQDRKNLEEHHQVVKMITNAMHRYCDEVQVAPNPIVYQLKNLQHLYTPVSGLLKSGYSIFDIAKELHPTPALGGTPTNYALKFIREHELLDRGWYGAPIGWVDGNQNGELAVAIRSALIQYDQASLFAGCGIMGDSDIQTEYEETNIKFQPMLTVFGG